MFLAKGPATGSPLVLLVYFVVLFVLLGGITVVVDRGWPSARAFKVGGTFVIVLVILLIIAWRKVR